MAPSYLTIRKFVLLTVIIVIISTSVGFYLSVDMIERNKRDVVDSVSNNIYLQAVGKAEMVNLWRKNILNVGDHITQSEMVRMFATELSRSNKEHKKNKQIPYINFILTEFTEKNELINTKLLGKNYKENTTISFSDEQKLGINKVLYSGTPVILPFYMNNDEVAVDVIKPVFKIGAMPQDVIGALLISHKVSKELHEILKPTPYTDIQGNVYLLQKNSDKTISYIKQDKIETFQSNDVEEISIGEKETTYTAFAEIENTPLYVLYEYDVSQVQTMLYNYKGEVAANVSLGIIIITILLLVIIWFMKYKYSSQRIRLQEQIMKALVRTISVRDPHLAEHNTALAKCVLKVGNKLGIPVRDRTTLFYSAMLSCISKLSVPEKILNKPDKLTDDEMKIVHDSVATNFKNLQKMEFDLPIQDVIIQMYERMDGSGYPNQLSGDEIGLLARILGAADVYCALTSSRVYRSRMTHNQAIEEMYKQEEKYDPAVLETIQDVMEIM